METRDETYGRRLAKLREMQGVTQGDLARAMRIQGHRWTQQTVAAVESGERQLKLAETVDAAALLNSTVDAIADAPEQAIVVQTFDRYGATLTDGRAVAIRTVDALASFVSAADMLVESGGEAMYGEIAATPIDVARRVVQSAVGWAEQQSVPPFAPGPVTRALAERILDEASELAQDIAKARVGLPADWE